MKQKTILIILVLAIAGVGIYAWKKGKETAEAPAAPVKPTVNITLNTRNTTAPPAGIPVVESSASLFIPPPVA